MQARERTVLNERAQRRGRPRVPHDFSRPHRARGTWQHPRASEAASQPTLQKSRAADWLRAPATTLRSYYYVLARTTLRPLRIPPRDITLGNKSAARPMSSVLEIPGSVRSLSLACGVSGGRCVHARRSTASKQATGTTFKALVACSMILVALADSFHPLQHFRC